MLFICHFSNVTFIIACTTRSLRSSSLKIGKYKMQLEKYFFRLVHTYEMRAAKRIMQHAFQIFQAAIRAFPYE